MPRRDDEDDYEDGDRPRRRPRHDDDYEDDDDDRPRRQRSSRDEFEATELLVPTGVSACSIIACYAGLVGMCLPVLGAPFALVAFVCAIIALRRRRSGSAARYGKVTSDIRAIVGLIFSSIGLLINVGVLLVVLFAKK
ncbi:MAG TPA: hypothetical protein VFG68_18725 [Fimbriiglobus sp.]|nr:hypothetical protein [Fimbriiglobus sp.]